MESNTVLIKVEGGSLTEEELIGHLNRLVSANFDWDVQISAPNMWVAPFPSKAEFTHAINIGSADLKNGLRLSFEKFEEEDEYFGHELPMVWMRTVNLPKVLRTYEVVWAIGTMFGATQKVDMITTRKSKFGRFKVVVLNPTIVPTKMDCVIGTRFFELRFVIEPFNPNSEQNKAQGHDGKNGDDNGKSNGDTEMEDANKKHKDAHLSSDKTMESKKHGAPASGMQQKDSGFNFDDDDLLDEETLLFSAPEIPKSVSDTAGTYNENWAVDDTKGERSQPEVLVALSREESGIEQEHPSQALGLF
ncbi:unnamed protein product [Urochloa humidicola]